MATINPVLKIKNKADKAHPLWVVLRHGKVEVVVATGQKVRPEDFDKTMVTGPNAADLNATVNSIRARLQRAYDQVTASGQPVTSDALRTAYAAQEGAPTTPAAPTRPTLTPTASGKDADLLVSFLDKRLQEQAHKLTPSTIRGYNSVRQALVRFNPVLRLTDVDRSCLYGFEAFLIEEGLRAHKAGLEGVKNASIENYMTKVKSILNYYADEPGVKLNYKKYRFELPLPEENVLHFTPSEFQDFLQHEMPRKVYDKQPNRTTQPDYDRMRDIMTVLVTTGLRFSDVFNDFRECRRVTRHGEEELHLVPQKTRKKGLKAIIPVTPLLRQVLNRHNWKLRKMEDYHFLQLLRQFCATIPSLQHEETTVEYIGQHVIKTRSPKWQLLGSHTGRRTFINFCFEKGLTIPQIMIMSAHTDPATLMVYANKTQNLAEDVAKIEGFQL